MGTCERFFNDYKKYKTQAANLQKRILNFELEGISRLSSQNVLYLSQEANPTIYFGSF